MLKKSLTQTITDTDMAGLQIDKASQREIVRKLQSMPKNIRRNAMASALTAGANVVRDRARRKAPSCIAPTIKTVRRRKRNGALGVSVIAGNARSWEDDGGSPLTAAWGKANKNLLLNHLA